MVLVSLALLSGIVKEVESRRLHSLSSWILLLFLKTDRVLTAEVGP